MQVDRQPVMDRCGKIGIRDRRPLCVRDRHEWHIAETEIERSEVGKILSAMQRCHSAIGSRPKQREMKLIDMKMQDVELVGAFADAIEHKHIVGNWIAYVRIKPQCGRYTGYEAGRGDGVATGEKSHIVTKANELFGEIRDDPFSSTICSRRHALDERCYLGDLHEGLH